MQEISKKELDKIAEVTSGTYILVFYSKTCSPCHTMRIVMQSFSEHNPDITVGMIDAQAEPELAQTFGVRSVPAIFFCRGREVQYAKVGVTHELEVLHIYKSIDTKYFEETGEIPPFKMERDMVFASIITVIIIVFAFLLFVPFI